MRRTAVLLCLAVLPGAAASDWERTDESAFHFEAQFEGSPVPGEFRDFDVALAFNDGAPDKAKLEVVVDLTSADMGDPEINAIIADPIWFGSAQHPRAVFRSERIEKRSDGEYVAHGQLALKGATEKVSVPFRFSGSADAARMQGEFVVRRTRFDVGSGEWASGDAIGLDVRLDFDVQLRPREGSPLD